MSLAQALVSSPPWGRLREATLSLRCGTPSTLGVFAHVGEDDQPIADALGWQVDRILKRLRPLAYQDVEDACWRLARKVRDHLGPRGLRDALVVGIPRGGQIVAGLLSYALSLPASQVGQSMVRDGPVILVDDCVLSGSRLSEWLHSNPGPSVVAAHLASTPACRHAIEAVYPRVAACLAAIDLNDHAVNRDDGWHERWRAREPETPWIGDPDHVIFPWNEPDSVVWNRRRLRGERGWRVAPPHWCMRNRADVAGNPAPIQINSVDRAGHHSPADGVVWSERRQAVLIARRGDDRAVQLAGVAAACWRQLATHGDVDRAVAVIAEMYHTPVTSVRSDILELVKNLSARGLLLSS